MNSNANQQHSAWNARAAQIRAGDTWQVVRALAMCTWLEAVRSRWSAILAIGILFVFAVAAFIGAWALVEREQVVLAITAPLTRLFAISVVALITISAVVREFNDRSIMLTLAAPISRATWILGKTLGFSLIAVVTALALSLPLIILAPALTTVLWAVSLAMELIVLVSAAILIACVLRQIPAAVLALMSFYLLARLIGVLLLIAERAPYETSAQVNSLNSGFLKLLSALLPRLDLFTQSIWLFEAVPVTVLWPVLTQSLLYCGLLWLIALLDFSGTEL
jgi:ABC-type transport system involved in multi-copper enzyme maturation permease subunit